MQVEHISSKMVTAGTGRKQRDFLKVNAVKPKNLTQGFCCF